MRRSLLHGSLAVLLATSLAGCDNIDESLITNPGPPPMITTTLAGALALRGAETRTFEVIPTGQTVSITATITAITRQDEQEPAAPIVVGMALGTWNGATCQVVLVNDNAFVGTTIVGSVSGYGMLCVRIYDVGRLEAPVNYSVDVVHPGQQES
jgi:hypothetical protein